MPRLWIEARLLLESSKNCLMLYFWMGNCKGWTPKWCLSYSWPLSESLCRTFGDTPVLSSFPIVTEDSHSPLRFITEFYLGLSFREIFALVFLCVVSLFFLNKALSKKCLLEFPGILGIHLLYIQSIVYAGQNQNRDTRRCTRECRQMSHCH